VDIDEVHDRRDIDGRDHGVAGGDLGHELERDRGGVVRLEPDRLLERGDPGWRVGERGIG
jgi:hypothetical protein